MRPTTIRRALHNANPRQTRTSTMSTTPSSPLKSSMLRVYSGIPTERAVAAIRRSIARLPRAFRPPAVIAAKTLP